MQETWVQSLDEEDPLEKGMSTHSSILAWRIPWIEEPDGLYSPWGRKESNMTEQQTRQVQFSSVAQLYPTLFNPMNRSMPDVPVHHHTEGNIKIQLTGT